jgi:hypothetical protein
MKTIQLKQNSQLSQEYLGQVLDFIRRLKLRKGKEKLDTVIASESSLKKDWLLPEEDEAWKDL